MDKMEFRKAQRAIRARNLSFIDNGAIDAMLEETADSTEADRLNMAQRRTAMISKIKRTA